MPVAKGAEVFNADSAPVTARGFQYNHAELEEARTERLPAILSDGEGLAAIADVCGGLELTNFGASALLGALQPFPQEDHSQGWREGEALAEAWLVDHEQCEFPWSFNRDLRHHRASMPGAEFVGFTGDDSTARFAFGQVKTSKEQKSPPQVVTNGAKSLVNQMLDLRDDSSIKTTLFRYLAYRAPSAHWQGKFRSAAKIYLNSGALGISIFGVLVRDTVPTPSDLASAAAKLSQDIHVETRVKFSGLYLPSGAIASGPQHKKRVRKAKEK
jgi:hypothetical protein